MAIKTRTYNNVTISTDQNNPTHIASVKLPSTTHSINCVMNAHRRSWTSMMSAGVLTIAIQKQLDDNSWQSVVQSTFNSTSVGKDGVHASFGARITGLGGKNCRLTAWCTTSIALDVILTGIF